MAVPDQGWTRGQDFFRTTPATVVIMAIWVLVFLATIIDTRIGLLLAYIPTKFPNAITGLVTYPLLIFGPGEIINLLFAGFMLYQFGGSLERGWGTRTYVLFLLASNIAAALLWTAGFFLFAHELPMMMGPWLMISSVIVAWAWINPDETILFWFVLPLKARWIGWLTIVLLYFLYPHSQGVGGWPLFILGFFALGGVAVAVGYDLVPPQMGLDSAPSPRQKTAAAGNSPSLQHPTGRHDAPLPRMATPPPHRQTATHL